MTATTIRAKLEEVALAKLGTQFRALPARFNVQGNDSHNLNAGVSAMWGGIRDAAEMSDQGLGVEQDFTLTIAKRTFVTHDDEKTLEQLEDIYEAIAEIIKSGVNDRFGLPADVIKVRLDGVSEPKPFNDADRDVISIELKFSVQYFIT